LDAGSTDVNKSDKVRWTISVPRETDVALRTYLAQEGLRKDHLSEFVTDAVRWRLFDLNLSTAHARNADVSSEEIEDAIKRALTEVRTQRFTKPV
jgi:Ribbon-helix-helix domain